MIFCTICLSSRHSSAVCPLGTRSERLAGSQAHAEGEGKVIFTRTDGGKVVIDNVRVDSVSPIAEIGNVIAAELFGSDRIIHVPFVASWEFDYRV